ncbi:formimidoylglutamase [uncultured Fusobacterium sp.]|jgi:formiminoglutamase|uniref:formimidoylglutamase n=1 Tax=uncultured Fusobacterium sp. TaxID=159267 RepID=UPI0025CF52A8|nr:formimidoylglutamase [uncultured Fusobacterium sp.]
MKKLWNGKIDSFEEDDLKLWQVVKDISEAQEKGGVCFVGYDTEDGILRDEGVAGASEGANAIRKGLSELPNIKNLRIYDYGNLEKKTLEEAQEEYSEKIADIYSKGLFPIGLGGGHDIVYGAYKGIRKAFPDKKIGIISFDAHLDIKSYDERMTSETSFKKILDEDKNVEYAITGFQRLENSRSLIKNADEKGVLVLEEEYPEEFTISSLKSFVKKMDIVYVTICMDVFDGAAAPGVSFPTVLGMDSKKGKRILRALMETKKVVCLDFAEINPRYDVANRTSRLAGYMIYETMEKLVDMYRFTKWVDKIK